MLLRLRIASQLIALTVSLSTLTLALYRDAHAQAHDARIISQVQDALIWTGHYNGMVDGRFGRGTLEAWRTFNREAGGSSAASPTSSNIHRLVQAAEARKRRVGFKIIKDDAAKIVIGIPSHLTPHVTSTRRGTAYTSSDGSLKIDTLHFRHDEMTLERLYLQVSQRGPIKTIGYQKPPGRADFVVAGTDHEKVYYFRAIQGAEGIFAVSLAYMQRREDELRRVVVATANYFLPASALNEAPRDDQRRSTEVANDTERREKAWSPSSGTGFYVTKEGHILTNAHVVDKCGKIDVVASGRAPMSAWTVATDRKNDLALLMAQDARVADVPTFRIAYRLGETIGVFGFPLSGLLSKTGNFTAGNVTATSGLLDDTTMLQISAPVQPGNSGGPVVNDAGQVIGVVVSKLNAVGVVKHLGDIPQNVNFAIKSSVAVEFLYAHGVRVEQPSEGTAISSADVAERARAFSVHVRCIAPK